MNNIIKAVEILREKRNGDFVKTAVVIKAAHDKLIPLSIHEYRWAIRYCGQSSTAFHQIQM